MMKRNFGKLGIAAVATALAAAASGAYANDGKTAALAKPAIPAVTVPVIASVPGPDGPGGGNGPRGLASLCGDAGLIRTHNGMIGQAAPPSFIEESSLADEIARMMAGRPTPRHDGGGGTNGPPHVAGPDPIAGPLFVDAGPWYDPIGGSNGPHPPHMVNPSWLTYPQPGLAGAKRLPGLLSREPLGGGNGPAK